MSSRGYSSRAYMSRLYSSTHISTNRCHCFCRLVNRQCQPCFELVPFRAVILIRVYSYKIYFGKWLFCFQPRPSIWGTVSQKIWPDDTTHYNTVVTPLGDVQACTNWKLPCKKVARSKLFNVLYWDEYIKYNCVMYV